MLSDSTSIAQPTASSDLIQSHPTQFKHSQQNLKPTLVVVIHNNEKPLLTLWVLCTMAPSSSTTSCLKEKSL